MGLPIHVRHPLGKEMIELEPQGADSPHIVGRSGDASVRIPSIQVGRQHCALFVHNGHWVVQDAGGKSGTFVNGKPLSSPKFLRIGDLIRLGADDDSPLLEIDPVSAAKGRHGYSVVRSSALEAEAEDEESLPEALTIPEAIELPAVSEETDDDDALMRAAAAAPSSFARRRPKRTLAGPITAVVMLAALALAAFAVMHVYKKRFPPAEPRVEKAKIAFIPATAPTSQRAILTTPQRALPPTVAQSPPKMVPLTMPAVSRTQTAQTKSAEPLLPENPTWSDVEVAYATRPPGEAIFVIDAYVRKNPGRFSSQASNFTETLFDRLWWSRIRDIWSAREALRRQIRQKHDASIAASPGQTRKLEAEQADMKKRLEGLNSEIEEMRYEFQEPPALNDAETLERLRDARDPLAYARWKTRLLTDIRRTKGKLPWELNPRPEDRR